MTSTRAYIGLGSNLGDRDAALRAAIAALECAPGVRVAAVSGFFETKPVGGPAGQGDYLNAALGLDVVLAPRALLELLLAVEKGLGRTREIRFGPRTIDLDLLLYDEECIEEPGLEVPHPRFRERLFVLEPLAEIAPGAIDPCSGRTIADLLRDLKARSTDL